MPKTNLELSVVVPVYNEYDNLEELTVRINKPLEEKFNYFEIIYVDDGSTDGSSELLDRLAESYEEVKAFHFTKNNGQTTAFAAGFDKAKGELIVTLDADLQVDPADIHKLLSYCNDYDLVIGIRENRQDNLIKKISSKIANGVRNWLTNEDIQDTGCPLKIFKKKVIRNLILFQGMHRFFPTLAKLKGYQVREVPVNHYPRKHGQSKYGINNRMWKGLLDTLAVRWMQKRNISYQFKEVDK